MQPKAEVESQQQQQQLFPPDTVDGNGEGMENVNRKLSDYILENVA